MKHSFTRLLLWPFLCLLLASTAAAQNVAIPPQDINAVGLTVHEVIDRLNTAVAANNDTLEGGGESSVQRMNALWPVRATVNTDPNVNMFGQYFLALKDAAHARFSGPCGGTSGFRGAWKCIGPDTLEAQNTGFVECLWVHPDNPDIILAGTYGGIFKSINRGKTWKNITDNTPSAFGIFSVTSIAVHPTNRQIIFATTGNQESAFETGWLNGLGGLMAGALLVSTDGGQNWTQEVVGTTQQPGDYLHRLQQIRFTPDGQNVIALRSDRIFIRPTNGTSLSWQEITNTTNNPLIISYGAGAHMWRDIEFVPGVSNNNDFFYAATANWAGAPVGAIHKFYKTGSTWASSPIFLGGTSNNTLGMDSNLRIEMSIPDNLYLYAAAYNLKINGQYTIIGPVMRYAFATQQWELVN